MNVFGRNRNEVAENIVAVFASSGVGVVTHWGMPMVLTEYKDLLRIIKPQIRERSWIMEITCFDVIVLML